MEDITKFLHQIDESETCAGIRGYESVTDSSKGIFRAGAWYSEDCEVILTNTTCPQVCNCCSRFKNSLAVMKHRLKSKLSVAHRLHYTPSTPSTARAYVANLKKSLKNSRSSHQRTRRLLVSSKLALKAIQRKFQIVTNESLVSAIQNADLPANTKLQMATAVQIAKAKSKHGRR